VGVTGSTDPTTGSPGPVGRGVAGHFKAAPADVRALIDEAFKSSTLAQAYAEQEFEGLSPEQKNRVVDYALETIAEKTQLLEAESNGSNNANYDKLTVSVARSGAPNARVSSSNTLQVVRTQIPTTRSGNTSCAAARARPRALERPLLVICCI